jgi:hypothetical protein
MLLMRIMWSFLWRKFSSVGMENDEMRWRMDKSSSLEMPMSPQEIYKKYKRQSLGMPKSPPSSSRKISGHLSRHYIFIASYAMCCPWSIRYFCFQFSFVLFAVINGLITPYLFSRKTHSIFIA